MAYALLRLSNLSKYFGGVAVLADVSLELAPGQIHGLVGQNGSGKSTLIKCLAGYHSPDSEWRLEVDGEVVTRGLRPGEASRLGISFVHQDLGVIGELTVLENLLFHRFGHDRRVFINWREEQRQARALLDSFDLALNPRAKLSTLRPVEQAQVAIIRSLMQLRDRQPRPGSDQPGRGVLVLDEATTFLDRTGRDSLHTLLRSIAAGGSGVLFVSHDIGEVLSLADQVTVLRDGRVVETAPSAALSADDVVGLIVGGDRSVRVGHLADAVAAERVAAEHQEATFDIATAAAPVERLEVRGLSGPHLQDVSFAAGRGEVLGLTGIVGSGWEFVLEHLYGAQPPFSGQVDIDGRSFELDAITPRRALDLGMILVPSKRLAQGIVAELSIQENVMLPVLDRSFTGGRLRLRELRDRCETMLRHHAVQPPLPDRPIGTLSGGNQQKAVLAKWLQLGPRVVLLSEPTQGVDVGARQLIFRIIRDAAQRGAVVLYASGDWDEVARLSDRVVVVADGRVAARLSGDQVSVEEIASAAYQGTRRSADLARASDMWVEASK